MFFIIHKDTRELIRESGTPFNRDEQIQPPLPLIQLKRVFDNTQPAYDEETQKLVQSSVDDDEAGTRTFFYEVVALTQDELDARAAQAAYDAELDQLRAVYQDLQNGVGTTNVRITRVERVAAFLGKSLLDEIMESLK